MYAASTLTFSILLLAYSLAVLPPFSIFHHRALFSFRSIDRCRSLPFSAKKLTKEQPPKQLPSRVQTALTRTQVTVVRIAADTHTHAPRGYPAGTVHRMSVYRVYRLTSRTPSPVYGSSSSNLEPISSSRKFH